MTVRLPRLPALLVLLLAPLASAPLGAQGIRYAPGTTSYRLSTVTRGSQTSPMGNQDFQIDSRQQITVNLATQTTDTLVATVTLDSLVMTSEQGAPDLTRLLGSKFVSFISPTGQLYSSKPPEGTDPLLAQVTEGVARFLPSYRSDMKPGMTWSDTSSGKVSQQGLSVDRTIVSHYRVVGDTAVSGEKALKVERVSTVKASGSGSARGTPIALESSTTSTGVFFISPRGHYLGGRQNDEIAVTITILPQNAQISIKQKAESRIDAIK